MTLSALARNISSLKKKLPTFVGKAFEENADRVMELQRQQLFEGLKSDGTYIKPSYSEDLKSKGGYFKTPEAAHNYAIWKAKLTYPYTTVDRPLDTPNLYIKGKFHSELGMIISEEEMEIGGMTDYAKDIVSKYGKETFGLTDESMEILMPIIANRVIQLIKEHIWTE